jgi:hypothetical protein
MEAGEESAILAVEPEGIMYALSELGGVTLDYLRGFRDCAQSLYVSASTTPPGGEEGTDLIEAAGFIDSPTHTWGLIATRASLSRFTGQGINVAVLDTGLFLAHPDYIGRSIVSRSFISGVVSANDGHGHGTHCTGTACGAFKPAVGPRYGIAHNANIYIGKVLSDQGSGSVGGILAGIDWATVITLVVVVLGGVLHLLSYRIKKREEKDRNAAAQVEERRAKELEASIVIAACDAMDVYCDKMEGLGIVLRDTQADSIIAEMIAAAHRVIQGTDDET